MTCSGCQWLMFSRYAPWCMKAGCPLLLVTECPCPHEPVYFEPMDVRILVEKATAIRAADI